MFLPKNIKNIKLWARSPSISVQLKLGVSKWPEGVKKVRRANFRASVFFLNFSHYCDWEWLGLTGGVVSIIVN